MRVSCELVGEAVANVPVMASGTPNARERMLVSRCVAIDAVVFCVAFDAIEISVEVVSRKSGQLHCLIREWIPVAPGALATMGSFALGMADEAVGFEPGVCLV